MREKPKPTISGEFRTGDLTSQDRYSRVPEELKTIAQWVNWRLGEDNKKIPVNPRTQGNAGVTFENTWAPFALAVAVGHEFGMGIGFVLTEDDPYTCIDLDKVVTGRTIEPIARQVVDMMSGYVELSPSGTGIHIWVRCREVINRRTKRIEIYSSQRWMTVTGRANPSAPRVITDRTDEVLCLVEKYFPVENTEFHKPQEITVDDTELWNRLFRSKNGAFVQALYRGDLSVVGNDHSRGVIMLANLLAVFTDGDEARMKQMLLQTGLVNDKWFEKRGSLTWIEYQIKDAIYYASQKLSR